MEALLVLSKDDLGLSESEAVRLLKPRSTSRFSELLFVKTDSPDLIPRLAYTRLSIEVQATISVAGLEKELPGIGLVRARPGSIAVRFLDSRLTHDQKAAVTTRIVRLLDKPDVDLKNPDIIYLCISNGTTVFIGPVIHDTTRTFSARKAHQRPALMPIAMDPRLARALINLTGIREGAVVDPFCGVGGVLIEAGLMGLDMHGIEIAGDILDKCEQNISHFGLKGAVLEKGDAIDLIPQIWEEGMVIASEPPFGKNTRQKDIDRLYDRFIDVIRGLPGMIAALSLPVSYGIEASSRNNGISCETVALIEVHRSMQKRICLLQRR
ncbi:MAG: hypothetical protein ABIC95_02700 [archaeon]